MKDKKVNGKIGRQDRGSIDGAALGSDGRKTMEKVPPKEKGHLDSFSRSTIRKARALNRITHRRDDAHFTAARMLPQPTQDSSCQNNLRYVATGGVQV